MVSKLISSFLLLVLCTISECKERRSLGEFITHYEALNYNFENLHRIHRRSVLKNDHFDFEFTAHESTFKLRLRRDTSIFTSDAKIQTVSGNPIDFDEDNLVVGSVVGEKGSQVFGGLNNGVFHGKISTADDDYYVDPAELYFDKPEGFHSVIYKGKDVAFDGAERMRGKVPDVEEDEPKHRETESERVNKRTRRATSVQEIDKSHCVLSLYADNYFVKLFGNEPSNAIFQMANQVRAVRAIYERNFNIPGYYKPKGLSFRVKNVVIYDPATDADKEPWKQVTPNNIGIDTLLDIFSTFDHKDICEAFLFTDRDFDGGILGLAWIGEANKAGGICDVQRKLGGGKVKSYNTGIVTMKLYGKFTPPKVSEVTFAHELGHGFGSQHDPDTKECAPGGTKGNYIMYSRATSGDRYHNNKFSNCSLKSIKANVDSKRSSENLGFCFIKADKSLCGNMVVEKGEQCDCGNAKTCKEQCCHPSGTTKECTLKDGVECSPSQGICCSASCKYEANNVCRNVTDCTELTKCGGRSFSCPEPTARPDNSTECAGGLKVCMKGECTLSVCNKYGLEECHCSTESELCDLCCQKRGSPDTCKSAKSMSEIPARIRDLKMVSGTPCDNMHGYCDVFHICRRIDMEGPLLRLTKKFLTVEGLKKTVKEYWWAILIGVVVLIVIIVLLVKLCSIYTPSNNPAKKKNRKLPGRRKKRQGVDREMQPRA